MNVRPRASFLRYAAVVLATFGTAACHEDLVPTDPPPPAPAITTITVTLPAETIALGQTITATAAGADQNGAAFPLEGVTWSSSSEATASVSSAGVVTGVAAGTANIVATSAGKSGQRTVTVAAPPAIVINEIESNGGTPGDCQALLPHRGIG